MGVSIINLTQRAFDSPLTPADLRQAPHIAVVNPGTTRRCRFFNRALEGSSKTVQVPALEKMPNVEFPFTDGGLTKRFLAAVESLANADNRWSIFVDVSCLPRSAIAEVFACCLHLSAEKPVELLVAYSLAAYAPPRGDWAQPNRAIRPVHSAFSGWTSEGASAPLDVVVGLGYEKGKATGAVEYLEPRHRWVWVPNSPEESYLREVQCHNKHLIEAGGARVSEYDVLAPAETYFSLRSQVAGIAKEARPVLLPFGPKLFFAINLLVAMTVEEAAVWHVSGESDDLGSRNPSRYSALLTCTIRSDGTTAPEHSSTAVSA